METLRTRLEEIFGTGKWIIAAQAAVSTGPMHRIISEWGSDPLMVAAHEGTGELESDDPAQSIGKLVARALILVEGCVESAP